MKWTLEEYNNQPAEFIDTIAELLKAEAKANNKK